MAAIDYCTSVEFRTLFPEFVRVPIEHLDLQLSIAAEYVEPSYFGSHTREAHAVKTAQLIAESPFGRSLQVAEGETLTTYEKRFNSIVAIVSPKVAVL